VKFGCCCIVFCSAFQEVGGENGERQCQELLFGFPAQKYSFW
jgi:hypothetical protein